MIDATFVMEQHLGHRSFYKNLRQFIESSENVRSTWVKVTYSDPSSWWWRLPLLPESLQGTLIGRSQVRGALQREPADVVFFNTQVPAVLAGSVIEQAPYVLCTDITPRQYDAMGEHYGHRPDENVLWAHYKHRANRRVFQGAEKVIPWSTWAADSLVRDYEVDPERIEVVPPGVDTALWRPPRTASSDAAGDEGPMRVLFVGGDFYRKGGDTLLKAYRQLPPDLVALDVVTRTRLPDEPGMRVHYGMQPNSEPLIALFHEADLLVLPTRAEAFGIVAVEAAAAGLPVLTTTVGGLTDIVEEGETGFLFPPDDAVQLSQHLHFMATNWEKREQMGCAARRRAEALFNARANATRIASILGEVASQA